MPEQVPIYTPGWRQAIEITGKHFAQECNMTTQPVFEPTTLWSRAQFLTFLAIALYLVLDVKSTIRVMHNTQENFSPRPLSLKRISNTEKLGPYRSSCHFLFTMVFQNTCVNFQNVLCIVSVVQGSDVAEVLGRRGALKIEVGPLDMWERPQIVRAVLAKYGKSLDESPFNNQVSRNISSDTESQ